MKTFRDVQQMAIELGFIPENVDADKELFTITDLDRGMNNLVIDCEDPIVVLE